MHFLKTFSLQAKDANMGILGVVGWEDCHVGYKKRKLTCPWDKSALLGGMAHAKNWSKSGSGMGTLEHNLKNEFNRGSPTGAFFFLRKEVAKISGQVAPKR